MFIRRKTPTVTIGTIKVGSGHPIAIQSMTNTPTANIAKTLAQIKLLADNGSEIVRITINDEKAAYAAEKIILKLRAQGYTTPIVGDFHYNGHLLLEQFPRMAKLLDKYRINPGNLGRGSNKNDHFAQIIRIAIKNHKPVRIGVNAGSIDPELLAFFKNKFSSKDHSPDEILRIAMTESALQNARFAEKLGLAKKYIILSVKMSAVKDMVAVYQDLAKRCDYVLHLGLTEAGGGPKGITASVSALAILLAQGIGDTLRISLTPQPGHPRWEEITYCKELLQALGMRYFAPTVISCPGCGRTASRYFEQLTKDIQAYIEKKKHVWQARDQAINQLTIAVMGCVVNGPGESKHANIGLSLPGRGEKNKAAVYIDGALATTLQGKALKTQFIHIIEDYIRSHYR